MPISRKRKKKGKKVQPRVEPPMRAGVTLQDLINVVAYQEHVKDGTIVAPGAEVHIPEKLPVTVGEGEDKRVVGTATTLPGVDGKVDIEIIDPDVASYLADTGSYSIEKEQS